MYELNRKHIFTNCSCKVHKYTEMNSHQVNETHIRIRIYTSFIQTHVGTENNNRKTKTTGKNKGKRVKKKQRKK